MLSTLPPKVIPADEHVQNNLYKLLRLHHKAHCCWPDLAQHGLYIGRGVAGHVKSQSRQDGNTMLTCTG